MRFHLPRALLIATIAATFVAAQPRVAAAGTSIDIVTTNWQFAPSQIVLHVGKPALLRFTSHEGFHAIESTDLGIPMTNIMPNQWAAVTVKPAKTGTYVLHCAIVCGAGHANMTLTVKVVP